MRVTQPINDTQPLSFNTIKILGCEDVTVGFQILNLEPTVSKRRYCNKILVHECVEVPSIDPLQLDKVEFLATDDPCYGAFNIYKSSETIQDIPPSITLQLDMSNLTVGILVDFLTDETSRVPIRMTYRLYGYPSSGSRIILTQGNLLISPCNNGENCSEQIWTGLNW